MKNQASLFIYSLLFFLPQLMQAEEPSSASHAHENTSKSYLDKIKGTIGQYFTPAKENPLYREWLKTKIEFDAKAFNQTTTFNEGSQPISIGAGLRYRYTVEPAYIRNYHHRFDRYLFNASLGTSFVENIGVGASVNATLTFARIYEDKLQAVKAFPYFPNRVPWTAERALEYLLPGEMTRLEMSLNGNVGSGESQDLGHGAHANAGISVGSGSTLILDVYRMKEHSVRLRIIGARSNANINLSAGIGLTKVIDFGAKIINRLTKNWIQLNPLSVGTSFNPIKALPMDTTMVDYIFDLKNEEAKIAFNQVMSQFYYLKFAEYLNFIMNDKTVGQRIEEQVKAAEDLYLKHKNEPIGTRPVDRIFKGQTTTHFWSTYANSQLKLIANFLRNNFNMYSAHSFVRGFDRDNEAVDLIYTLNNKSSDFSTFRAWFRTASLDSLQGLFLATRKENTEEVMPTTISDLVFNRNLEDANLSRQQIAQMKYYIQSSAGNAVADVDWSSLENGQRKTNGYIRSQIVIHQELINELSGKFAVSQIYTKLREIVDHHPYKDYLPVTFNTLNTDDAQNKMFDKHEEDIRFMAYKLSTFLNDPDPEKRLQAYGELRILNLFNEIGPAVIVASLPPEKVKDLIFVRISAGSAAGSLITHVSGKEDVSQIYSSLQFMLAVINDRSFDLRVQLDGNSLQIFKMKNDATQNCTNCDTTSTTVEKIPITSFSNDAKDQ